MNTMFQRSLTQSPIYLEIGIELETVCSVCAALRGRRSSASGPSASPLTYRDTRLTNLSS